MWRFACCVGCAAVCAITLLVAAGHLHAGVAGDVVPQQLPAGPLPRHYLHPVQQRHHAACVHYTTRHQ